MKKLAFLFVVLLFAGMNSNAQTVIGKIENGIGKITINETTLKSKWENYLKSEGIKDANIGNFALLKSKEGNYFLICSDLTVRNNITSQYGVTLSPNGVMLAVGETSCTCTGSCSDGCHPEQSGSTWRCTTCWPENATCTKTETAKSGSSLY
jgi:hypothetical protein